MSAAEPSSPPSVAGTILTAGAAVAALGLAATTGALAGPLAALTLLPLAVAVRGGLRPAALGVVLSLSVAALLGLAQAAGAVGPTPEGWAATGLAIAALTAVLGLGGAGLIAALRTSERRGDAAAADRDRLERLLLEQPGLTLLAGRTGRVSAAYGEPPEGVPAERLFAHGLAAAAQPRDEPALLTAAADAFDHGEAHFAFAPAGAPDRLVTARFRRMSTGKLAVTLDDGTDLTERVRAAEARAAEAVAANAAKSRFLAGMSHELRTLLNAIMGFSDVMRARLFGGLPDRYATYPELIHQSGTHLLDLINDLLDMSKIEAEKYQLRTEPLDAREPVKSALAILRVQADEAGVALRADLPAAPVAAEADRRALKQIVFNLVGNALKFTPRGGTVTVALAEADGALELTVVDTGVGIAPEDLERLGRPYEQAGDASSQAQGTGLGLSLVKALAGLHGGTLGIESALGEGAAVTVRLPVLKAEAAAKPDNVIPFVVNR